MSRSEQQSEQTVGICLFDLPAKEQAVIKRVVTFSASQGRNYALKELDQAQLVIVCDETTPDFEQMNPDGSLVVRIADAGCEEPYDVLMARPLLVTRVMRSLDEARQLWESMQASLDAVEEAPEAADYKADKTQDCHATVTESEQSEVKIAATAAAMPDVAKGVSNDNDDEEVPETPVPETADATPPEETPAPSVTDTAEEPEPEPEPEPAAAAESAYNHHALVVDDSAAIRKQLELELRDANISADFAEDGEKALEKIDANKYDLIFLDIIMPGIDGFETCRQMRTRKELKKTPIIMLSAKTSPLDEVQGVIAGASTYLPKPVKSDQLQKTLARVSKWLDNFSG